MTKEITKARVTAKPKYLHAYIHESKEEVVENKKEDI